MRQIGAMEQSAANYHYEDSVTGLVSLVHIRHWLFGNCLVSMPFFDAGGVLATDMEVERMLVDESLRIASDLCVSTLELRQYHPLTCLGDQKASTEFLQKAILIRKSQNWYVSATTNKFRLLLKLQNDSEALMNAFKAKLRNQIRKPLKEGLIVKIGKLELLDDFYNVFAENMRDLGSPVHSRNFIQNILVEFSKTTNIFVVYGEGTPLAGSVTIGFKDTLYNPWASSLRRYSHLAPNMLLYWSMLEFACQNGYQRFDFGRSTPGEGTYKFKEQWGAKPEPLYWYRFSRKPQEHQKNIIEKDKMATAIKYWKKLPVPLTKIIGPPIRKYINL
ncbi:MAG: GNAT family N-acetyltransferase [Gammaproteobacteria bacterium]